VASTKEIEKRKAILRARGVPEKFIDNIARRKGATGLTIAVILAATAAMMALLIGPMAYEDHVISILAPYLFPYADHSLLFRGGNGIGSTLSFAAFFCVFMVLIVWSDRRRNRPSRPFPAYDITAASLRIVRQNENLETIAPNPAYSGLDYLPDDTAFLTRIRPERQKGQAWAWVGASCILLFPMAAHLVPAFITTSADLDAVTERSLQKTTVHAVKDAKFAYAVCYDNPRGQPDFDYRVAFKDTTISLWQRKDPVHELEGDGIVERIGRIDQRLKALGIPIHRMPTAGSIGVDGEECVTHATRYWHLKSPETLHRLVFG
jgi:hypothetical protein